ncbi:MAG: hypothetical protein JKY56_20505 [Kofleriaceae bacterium]|nr:hypothetical protein [Kofleriaceae bacterium]
MEADKVHSRYLCLTIGLLLCEMGACWSPTSASRSAPEPAEPAEPALTAALPAESAESSRVIRLEDGSYVELRPGQETGFAYCCGEDLHKLEIDCSEGLVRCYRLSGKRWQQTYGKHCKSALDTQCYQQTCAKVCEAYWELGPTAWKEIIP